MKKLFNLCLTVLFIIGMTACGNGRTEEECPVPISENQAFAMVELKSGEELLLISDGTYQCDEVRAGVYADVYLKDNGEWKKCERVAGSGTAYPICYDDGGIYTAGGHFVAYYTVDAEGKGLQKKEYAEEIFDENGNATYIYYADGKEQTVENNDRLMTLFEKYHNAEMVGFYGQKEAEKVIAEESEKTTQSGDEEAETADGQDKEKKPDMQSEEPDEEDETAALFEEMRKGSTILEDEQAIYLCGEDRICRIDKEEDSSEILWQGREAEESVYLYSKGSGLLAGDRIYFIENLHSPDGGEEQSALSMISTDGEGYKRLEKLSGNTVTLFRQEDILYAGSYDSLNCYKIFPDGALKEIEPEEVDARYGIILDKYERMQYVYAGGGYLTLPESLEIFGYFLVYNDDSQLVKVEPETGEETIVMPEGSVRGYNKEYLLSFIYGGEETGVYLTDAATWESSLLTEWESYVDVIDMDADYAYVGREDGKEGQYIYERISLKNGECEELFAQNRMIGMGCAYTQYAFGPRIQNGSIYYAGEDEYKLYVMYRELANPDEEETLGEAYYDSGISEVGSVELYEENIYSEVKPEILLTEISWERLVVDKSFLVQRR